MKKYIDDDPLCTDDLMKEPQTGKKEYMKGFFFRMNIFLIEYQS